MTTLTNLLRRLTPDLPKHSSLHLPSIFLGLLLGALVSVLVYSLLGGIPSKEGIENIDRTPIALDVNSGQLGQTVTDDLTDIVANGPLSDPIKDAIKDEHVLGITSSRSKTGRGSGKIKTIPAMNSSLDLELGIDKETIIIGKTEYNGEESTLSYFINPLRFENNVVLSEDDDGWKTYSELWLFVNDVKHKLPLDMENSHTTLLRKVIPPITSKFHWWAPQASVAIGVGAGGYGIGIPIGPVAFVANYGPTKIDAKWLLFGVGLDAVYSFINQDTWEFGGSFLPAAYRPFDRVVTNTYLAPFVGYSSTGFNGGLKFVVRF